MAKKSVTVKKDEMVSKQEFYKKLLNKLILIKKGDMTLDEYIREVAAKIEHKDDGIEVRIENGKTNFYQNGKLFAAQG